MGFFAIRTCGPYMYMRKLLTLPQMSIVPEVSGCFQEKVLGGSREKRDS